MDSDSDNRKGKPTAADKAASAKLYALWQAIPESERPSQEQIAAEWRDGGVSQSAISQYMTGRSRLGLRAVLRFAAILRCKPYEIRDDIPELRDAALADAQVDNLLTAGPKVVRIADAWPFKFEKLRFDNLRPDQRREIGHRLLGMIEAFEAGLDVKEKPAKKKKRR